jgi:hypothetical protein
VGYAKQLAKKDSFILVVLDVQKPMTKIKRHIILSYASRAPPVLKFYKMSLLKKYRSKTVSSHVLTINSHWCLLHMHTRRNSLLIASSAKRNILAIVSATIAKNVTQISAKTVETNFKTILLHPPVNK